MSNKITSKIQSLSQILQETLVDLCPCSEYQLIQSLRDRPELSWLAPAANDPHQLFQQHFLLFHVLYQLQQVYRQQQRCELQISPMQIQLLPYLEGEQAVAEVDPVRDYYLDLSQLQNTSAEDVDTMLGRFWCLMSRDGQREAALSVLGLSDPVDNRQIRKSYQRLAMQHHPDRGGDGLRLQEINLAMDILLRK